MSSDLTGDYDVVVEFSVEAVNRVLAAMHSGNRFPHSLSFRVDDSPPLRQTCIPVVDLTGKPVTNQLVVSQTVAVAASSAVRPAALIDTFIQNADPIVNTRDLSAVGIVYSHLKGVAQLQLGAPTMQLPNDSSASATFHTPVFARYFADSDTIALPDFLRGEFLITLGVNESSSKAGGAVIDVNLAGVGGNIHFHQLWPPQLMSAAQLKAVNQVLTNSLITSFQPASAPLPQGVVNMVFKTLSGQNTVAVLMSLTAPSVAPNPGSAQQAFLGQGDQFAIAVSADYITGQLTDQVNTAIDPYRSVSFGVTATTSFGFFSLSFTTTVNITLGAVGITLQEGQVQLTIQVSVHMYNDSPVIPSPPDFSFTLSQLFTMGLSGGAVVLQLLGNVTTAGVPSVPFFDLPGHVQSNAQNIFLNFWNNPGSNGQVQQSVANAFSAGNLQVFLQSLMNQPGTPPQDKVNPTLTYTSVEIHAAGVILHGQLDMPDWPAPHVEFDLNLSTANAPHPEYSALNSWIPGGTIQDYVWSYNGNAMPPDPNTFISTNAPPLGFFSQKVCLQMAGSRISASGEVTDDAVSASLCLLTQVPRATFTQDFVGPTKSLPFVGITAQSSDGELQIVAHTSLWAPAVGFNGATVNLIVHFPSEESVRSLSFLTHGLHGSGRPDAATAIVCVLARGQLAQVHPADRLIFADDAQGWGNLLHVHNRPATVLLGTSGEVLWRHDGDIASGPLATALKHHLAPGGMLNPRLIELQVKIGQRAPNFIFEYSRGRETTLRKLAGRQAVLVFWKRSSHASLATLSNLQEGFHLMGGQAPLVLGIADGEDAEAAKESAASHRLVVTVVADPRREIAGAYGVTVWPTAVFLDTMGVVQDIRYGLISKEEMNPFRGHGRYAPSGGAK